jgi:hypothetical protein
MSSNRFARASGLAVLVLGLLAVTPARAVLEPDGSDDSAYRALGAQYAGKVLWYQFTRSDGAVGYLSAVRLNEHFALTAAHAVFGSFGLVTNIVVGTGTNYLTSPGTSVTCAVSNVLIYPGWNQTFNTPDIAIIKFDQPLPGENLAIASASVGETLSSAGFGRAGTPSSGLLPSDGNLRAFYAPVQSFTPGNVSGEYYWDLRFSPASGVALNGKGLGGDSGGPVFNASGNLVGISIAQWGNLDPIGGTDILKLTQADVYAWIQNNITPVEPQILSLTREGADVRLAWQGKGGSNYVVQAASALGGTNGFTDLSAVLALPGVGPVTTNFLDAGALTNFPVRFYRIRTN